MIAKIAVSAATFAIDKPYSYRVPGEMPLEPGMRVSVPFGRGNRITEGIVLALEDGDDPELKWVSDCLDSQALLPDTMLRLAAFMRERYFCTFFEAIRAMLPAGLWFQTRERYALTQDRSWQSQKPRQAQALALLEFLAESGGEADGGAARQVIPQEAAFEKAVSYLLKKKWITAQRDFLRRTGDKTERIATLAASAEEAMDYAAHRPKSAAMQKAVLELLCSVGSVSVKELCYYTGAKTATIQRLEKLGYLTLSERPVVRCRQIQPVSLSGPLVLEEAQHQAYLGMAGQMDSDSPGAALLHGVTGSGKTSVYIQLIRKALDSGGSAMLLVPEIGLTPQLLGLMAAYFGDKVAVLHSSLPPGERYDQWKRIRAGEARVVVGTRSAVFAPCRGLRLMILDEEQEHSYRSENSPRYSAKEVALWRGAKEKALVVFGSATPSVETMYQAKMGRIRLYRLTSRFANRPLPQVSLVDMREELKNGNDTSISVELLRAIADTAAQGKQTILFLNRRGNSRALVCVDCRKAPECPRCSARLTYHSANERLMCHYCGFSQPVPRRCPQCGGPLKREGMGTQKVEQELQALLPGLRMERMDADTVSSANTHEMILERFREEKIPLLLGTQMVAKGLDLPNVTLVGVLDGDLSLYSDNFRAGETTFNMLTQVIGRAGRGTTPGQAIIQTVNPTHGVITLAAKQDYDGFYELESGLRRIQALPPYGDVAYVTFTGQDEGRVLRGGAGYRQGLLACLAAAGYEEEQCTVLGPAPCPVPKINYHFRYRLTLRCRMTKKLRSLLAHLLRRFARDPANRGVSAFIDVNGFD